MVNGQWLYGLSFVPSFLLWLFLLDENALLGGVWAVLLTQIALWGLLKLRDGWLRRILMIVAFAILYWIAFGGSHYYRNPTIFPTLLYAAWFSAIIIPLVMWFVVRAHTSHLFHPRVSHHGKPCLEKRQFQGREGDAIRLYGLPPAMEPHT